MEFAIDRAMPVFIPPDMSCDITHSRCWPLRVSGDIIGASFARGRLPRYSTFAESHLLRHWRAGTLARCREITNTHRQTHTLVRFDGPRDGQALPSTAKHKARDVRLPHNSKRRPPTRARILSPCRRPRLGAEKKGRKKGSSSIAAIVIVDKHMSPSVHPLRASRRPVDSRRGISRNQESCRGISSRRRGVYSIGGLADLHFHSIQLDASNNGVVASRECSRYYTLRGGFHEPDVIGFRAK